MKQKKQSWWDNLTSEEKERRTQERIKKFKQTCLEKYGVSNPAQAKEVKEKTKQTCLEKYGTVAPLQNKTILEKMKKTNLERYGKEVTSQNDNVKQKQRQTNLRKYGVEYTSQIPETRESAKKTWLKKYGADHPLKCNKIKKKIKQTCLERYGAEYSLQSQEIRDKGKQTCLEKYGVENPSQAEEIKEKKKKTSLKHYGVENPSQTEEIKGKIKHTFLEKYGVESSLQSPLIRDKIKQRLCYNGYKKILNSNKFKSLITPLFSLEDFKGTITKGNRHFYKFQCKKCGNVFVDRLSDGRIPRCFKCFPIDKFTLPHKTICEFLDSKNILYEVEKYISPYWVDIFIEPNKIIEIYGDYWHGNPKLYEKGITLNLPSGKLLVEEKWKDDEKRIKYLEEQGNTILVIWENETKTNPESTQKKIEEFIKNEANTICNK